MTTATLPDLSNLSLDQKLAMIDSIWDSIDNGKQPPVLVPEWLKEELRQQHQEYLRNPQRTSTWEEAKARILSRHAETQHTT